MPEFDRLNECSDWIELDFVEREATPEPLMKLSIHLHAAGLSLSDTVSVLEKFGVECVFKEQKRRTKQFANYCHHATHRSAENWLQTFAFVWNQLL